MSDLLDSSRARAWAAEDPDPVTKAELEALIDRPAGEVRELADRFAGTLEFGTAGLRGALGAGSNRMNRVVVTRAAAGLAAYLKDTGAPAGAPVVIGYDARHNSDVFARDTAEVMTGRGSARAGDAAAAADAAAGLRDPRARVRGRRDGHREPQPAAGQRLQGLPRRRQPDRAARRRRDRRAHRRRRCAGRRTSRRARRQGPRRGHRRPLPRHRGRARGRRTARPAHGLHAAARRRRHVGAAGARDRGLRRARRSWSSRSSPTRTSRPSSFPNPEEPGAMDLAMALADAHHVDLVVANDPDADRCAAAVPESSTAGGCCAATRSARCSATTCCPQGKPGTYACSIVSSSLLGKHGGRARPAVRRDAHGLQVDQPGARASRSATRRRSATASTPST